MIKWVGPGHSAGGILMIRRDRIEDNLTKQQLNDTPKFEYPG